MAGRSRRSVLVRCAAAVVVAVSSPTTTTCRAFTCRPSAASIVRRASALGAHRLDGGEVGGAGECGAEVATTTTTPTPRPAGGGAPRSRREALLRSAAAAAGGALVAAAPRNAVADIVGVVTPSGLSGGAPEAVKATDDAARGAEGGGVRLFVTKSGVKYIELREGTGPTPRYGQLVSISYKAYVKLPVIKGTPSKLDEFDSDRTYLIKHGNGRTVPGLDEGIHTMRVGGKRRIIIPPKLGYVAPGLGPIPEGPLARMKLNGLLDRMVEVRGGNVVFDVELRSAMDDEADQGYYEDGSLSPEDFDKLRRNLQNAGIEARAASLREVQPADV